MSHVTLATPPDNGCAPGTGGQTATRPAIETVEILRGRDSFAVKILTGVDGSDEARPCRCLATSGTFLVLPDTVTPEWVRKIAEGVATGFTLWQAGAPQ
jgi:hypothetical protein